MNWLQMFWNSPQVLSVAFKILTAITILCSVLIFTLKLRQDVLSGKKAERQTLFIAEQAEKISQQQSDLKKVSDQARELQQKAEFLAKQAINSERNIADTYDFKGVRRIRHGGRISATFGPETSVFERMVELQQRQLWNELQTVTRVQMVTTPLWLTPYLFSAVAEYNLGDKVGARRLLEHVVRHAGDDPDYKEAHRLLEEIPE